MTIADLRPLFLLVALLPLAGCGGSTHSSVAPAADSLPAANINLIFVPSEDLKYNQSEDIDPSTANLTDQGLQRTLLMASYLKNEVLGGNNVTGIYALEPMTHLQTANHYPDMVPLESIEQFALLNQVTLPESPVGSALYTANSFPVGASYAVGQTVNGVASPLYNCSGCQGLDFNDQNGDNETLIKYLLHYGVAGYYVFSAPWETTQSLLQTIGKKYNITPPSSYQGPNYVYTVSIPPSGSASLKTYNSNLKPESTYPKLSSSAVVSISCQATPFSITAKTSSPPVSNTNETLYLMRHAEAHPVDSWEDGNLVAAGQWRALDIPNALSGKISPDEVYSIDPAQTVPAGNYDWSYIRPSLTIEPYAIANHLPLHLVAGFEMYDAATVTANTNNFFFNSPEFKNHKVLLAWEHAHFAPMVNALLQAYGSTQTVAAWDESDYDSIWTVKLDSAGNLSVDNSVCEGIQSSTLPATAPPF
jgi:hypothetical protein